MLWGIAQSRFHKGCLQFLCDLEGMCFAVGVASEKGKNRTTGSFGNPIVIAAVPMAEAQRTACAGARAGQGVLSLAAAQPARMAFAAPVKRRRILVGVASGTGLGGNSLS